MWAGSGGWQTVTAAGWRPGILDCSKQRPAKAGADASPSPPPPAAPLQRCLTPPSALDGECGFLAANLYARSVFGEDALVNVSVEKLPDGRLGGYIRIRSKTQGIALSLGDKLILKQKG